MSEFGFWAGRNPASIFWRERSTGTSRRYRPPHVLRDVRVIAARLLFQLLLRQPDQAPRRPKVITCIGHACTHAGIPPCTSLFSKQNTHFLTLGVKEFRYSYAGTWKGQATIQLWQRTQVEKRSKKAWRSLTISFFKFVYSQFRNITS
jgi:hypothetical protein